MLRGLGASLGIPNEAFGVCAAGRPGGGEAVLLSMGAVGMELCPTQGCAALNFC